MCSHIFCRCYTSVADVNLDHEIKERMSSADFLVAALDFGTTYSGYAYSFRQDFINNPLKIFANIKWSSDDEGGTNTCTSANLKTPTTILFKPSGQFHSFGYEAEKKYAELAEEDEIEGWKYFKRFKMKLYQELGVDSEGAHNRRKASTCSFEFMQKDYLNLC